jgi:hypothetical protein
VRDKKRDLMFDKLREFKRKRETQKKVDKMEERKEKIDDRKGKNKK